jgi:hypothetical protein
MIRGTTCDTLTPLSHQTSSNSLNPQITAEVTVRAPLCLFQMHHLRFHKKHQSNKQILDLFSLITPPTVTNSSHLLPLFFLSR